MLLGLETPPPLDLEGLLDLETLLPLDLEVLLLGVETLGAELRLDGV